MKKIDAPAQHACPSSQVLTCLLQPVQYLVSCPHLSSLGLIGSSPSEPLFGQACHLGHGTRLLLNDKHKHDSRGGGIVRGQQPESLQHQMPTVGHRGTSGLALAGAVLQLPVPTKNELGYRPPRTRLGNEQYARINKNEKRGQTNLGAKQELCFPQQPSTVAHSPLSPSSTSQPFRTASGIERGAICDGSSMTVT